MSKTNNDQLLPHNFFDHNMTITRLEHDSNMSITRVKHKLNKKRVDRELSFLNKDNFFL